jgi:hypothetical protein
VQSNVNSQHNTYAKRSPLFKNEFLRGHTSGSRATSLTGDAASKITLPSSGTLKLDQDFTIGECSLL